MTQFLHTPEGQALGKAGKTMVEIAATYMGLRLLGGAAQGTELALASSL